MKKFVLALAMSALATPAFSAELPLVVCSYDEDGINNKIEKTAKDAGLSKSDVVISTPSILYSSSSPYLKICVSVSKK